MPQTVIKWRIKNKPKLWFFGKNLVDITTRWNVSKGKPGDWGYTGKVGPVSLIPIREGWIQEATISEYFEEGEYMLHLTITCSDKEISSHTMKIKHE
jgi:hypothetical protein